MSDDREKTYYAWRKAGARFRVGEFYGALCVTLSAPGLWVDADINRRWPFGVCLGVKAGRKHPLPGAEQIRHPRYGFSVDLNAPHGEPNRLHLSGLRRFWMIGLISWHEQVETGTHQDVIMGEPTTVHDMKTVRCRPHLVRGQGWDWKTGRALDWRDDRSWRWIVSHPRKR